jgi:hypothetical protein
MRRSVFFVIALITLAALAADLYFMHAAGCAGDLKGGAVGNPQAALALEGRSLGFMLLFLFGSAFLGYAYGRSSVGLRVVRATGTLVIAFAATLYLGIQAEVTGVQECWASR